MLSHEAPVDGVTSGCFCVFGGWTDDRLEGN